MKFWLVSRETMEEAKSSRDRIIARLEQEILELKEDRKVTVDILSVRALGMPIYGKIKPPMEEDPELEPKAGEDEPSGSSQPGFQMGGRARAIAQAVGATNLERYSKEQAHMQALVEQAIEEGRRAAEVQPLNGNHS